MSHNITVDKIKIKNIDALRSAIHELAGSGVKISLEENAHYRGYNVRESGTYPYVIQLPNSRYDVALTPDKDGEGYVPVFDTWNDQVRNQLGYSKGALADASCDINSPEAHIGRLMQLYGICEAEMVASQQGLYTTRQFDEKTKVMNLIVEGV